MSYCRQTSERLELGQDRVTRLAKIKRRLVLVLFTARSHICATYVLTAEESYRAACASSAEAINPSLCIQQPACYAVTALPRPGQGVLVSRSHTVHSIWVSLKDFSLDKKEFQFEMDSIVRELGQNDPHPLLRNSLLAIRVGDHVTSRWVYSSTHRPRTRQEERRKQHRHARWAQYSRGPQPPLCALLRPEPPNQSTSGRSACSAVPPFLLTHSRCHSACVIPGHLLPAVYAFVINLRTHLCNSRSMQLQQVYWNTCFKHWQEQVLHQYSEQKVSWWRCSILGFYSAHWNKKNTAGETK